MAERSLLGAYGKYLAEKGREIGNLVVLEADLKEATQTVQFEREFPERFFQIGIAEQNMAGIAAGFALGGKIPLVHSFAVFLSMRSCEQVRTSIAYPNLNVKLIASFAGLSAGSAGATHHSIEDIAIMRAIPNMTVLCPGDVTEMSQVMDEAVKHEGPVYIRLGAVEADESHGGDHRFEIGKATELRSGDDATIVSTGALSGEAVGAADILRKKFGVNVMVLQMASIKPFDSKTVVRAAEKTGHILTVEEHNVIGGLGDCVCEVVAELSPARVKRLGISDAFSDVGARPYLLASNGLTIENIVSETLELIDKSLGKQISG